jgi:enoyl-CoA hydratase
MPASPNDPTAERYERLLISQDGPVRIIEMNVPAKCNPFGFGMAEELSHAVKSADQDPAAKVIIIGGIGETFSGGHDLSSEGLQEYIDTCATAEATWERGERYFFHKAGLEIWATDTPTIARVQGAAVLGAFALANVCDLIVAADDAIFWTPSARMYGPAAEMFMEPWVMGARRAKEYLFTGDPMSAAEAYRVGMVNRIVPRAELDKSTMELAQRIAKNPSLGLKLVKRAVNNTLENQGFRQALEYAFLLHTFAKSTQGYQREMWQPMIENVKTEGLSSYLESRDRPFEPK